MARQQPDGPVTRQERAQQFLNGVRSGGKNEGKADLEPARGSEYGIFVRGVCVGRSRIDKKRDDGTEFRRVVYGVQVEGSQRIEIEEYINLPEPVGTRCLAVGEIFEVKVRVRAYVGKAGARYSLTIGDQQTFGEAF